MFRRKKNKPKKEEIVTIKRPIEPDITLVDVMALREKTDNINLFGNELAQLLQRAEIQTRDRIVGIIDQWVSNEKVRLEAEIKGLKDALNEVTEIMKSAESEINQEILHDFAVIKGKIMAKESELDRLYEVPLIVKPKKEKKPKEKKPKKPKKIKPKEEPVENEPSTEVPVGFNPEEEPEDEEDTETGKETPEKDNEASTTPEEPPEKTKVPEGFRPIKE